MMWGNSCNGADFNTSQPLRKATENSSLDNTRFCDTHIGQNKHVSQLPSWTKIDIRIVDEVDEDVASIAEALDTLVDAAEGNEPVIPRKLFIKGSDVHGLVIALRDYLVEKAKSIV